MKGRTRRRLEYIERNWIRHLSDEQLRVLAGETTLEEEVWLSSCSTVQLEQLAAGRRPIDVLTREQLLQYPW